MTIFILKVADRLVSVSLVLVVLLSSFIAGKAEILQETWKDVAPEGESFKVQMPANASEGTRRVNFSDKDWISTRVYFSLAGNKRFSVYAFRKTTKEQSPYLTSFTRFVEAVEVSFSNHKRAFMFEYHGGWGGSELREYQLKINEFKGVAELIEAGQTFYVLVVTGASCDGPDVARFFSSFKIGAVNEVNQATGVEFKRSDYLPGATSNEQTALEPPELWPTVARPIFGGVLSGKAVSLPKPEYPLGARAAGISGTVVIRILISENGSVLFAEPSEGPQELWQASVIAAQNARFTPARLMGQPVKVSGQVMYHFARN